jgi:type I restriction enzyme M protein
MAAGVGSGCPVQALSSLVAAVRGSMLDDIKKTLWAAADKLRANMDAAEYKHLVLGLIFLKYISDTFQARQDELQRRLSDPADEYFYADASEED